MLIDKKVTELLDAFASPDPTPGGGSAAALAGAMGAALLAMVAGLPKTRTGAPEERAAMDRAQADLTRCQRRLTELIDRDTAAYDLVVAAYKKPKATDDEKAARQRAIQDGMRAATEVPLETMQAAAEALKVAPIVGAHGNPSAMSDATVGTHLLTLAISGAMANVGANIGSLKDASLVGRIKQDAKDAMMGSGAAMREAFTSGGMAELTRDIQTKLDLPRHGTPPDGNQLVVSLTQLLRHIGTPDTRRALEVLADGTSPEMREAAKTALSQMPPKP